LLIESEPKYGADKHLLGHYAGDQLYEERGLEGMQICTPDLWYACAHSIVIGALIEQGLSVFDEIHDICEMVPGPNGYPMCFHGFGHGVIAYTQYEVPDALELCQRLGTPEHNYLEGRECAGGAIMDLRDGLHDRDLWEAYGRKYIPEGNPIMLCEADYMPDEFREICYIYITPFLLDYLGANNIPTDQEIDDAMGLCEEASSDLLLRACYEGFPKELIAFLHNRDVEAYANTTDEQFKKFYEWCSYADSQTGLTTCLQASVNAVDRGGTWPYEVGARYCELIPNEDHQNICYERLVYTRAYSNIPPSANAGLCEIVPEDFVPLCNRLVIERDL